MNNIIDDIKNDNIECSDLNNVLANINGIKADINRIKTQFNDMIFIILCAIIVWVISRLFK